MQSTSPLLCRLTMPKFHTANGTEHRRNHVCDSTHSVCLSGGLPQKRSQPPGHISKCGPVCVQVVKWAELLEQKVVGCYVAQTTQTVSHEDTSPTAKAIVEQLVQRGCSPCSLFVVCLFATSCDRPCVMVTQVSSASIKRKAQHILVHDCHHFGVLRGATGGRELHGSPVPSFLPTSRVFPAAAHNQVTGACDCR